MPLIYRKYKPTKFQIAIWKITEDEDFFRSKLLPESHELKELDAIKGRKRLEWLAARYLIQHLMGPSNILVKKDGFGKPFFIDFEEELSISHSWNLAAIMIGMQPNGIDIQYEVPSIKNIAKKFVNETESQFENYDSLANLHFIWGAKECMYKAYGRKRVDFKKHMTLSDVPHGESAQVTGLFNKKRQEYFDVYYEEVLGYYLCYAELRTDPLVDPRTRVQII